MRSDAWALIFVVRLVGLVLVLIGVGELARAISQRNASRTATRIHLGDLLLGLALVGGGALLLLGAN